MVTVEPSQEEQNEPVEIVEMVEEIKPSSTKASKISFDFQVDATDRLGLNVYTVSMQGQDGDWITSTILAPTYGTALALAGMSQDNTIKISEIPFEG